MSGDRSKENKLSTEEISSSDPKQKDLDAGGKLSIKKTEPLETEIKLELREIKNTPVKLVAKEKEEQEPEVTRLEKKEFPGETKTKPDQVKFEKLADGPSVEEKEEQQWGQANSGVGWWILGGGAALVVLVIAAIILSNYFTDRTIEEEKAPEIELVLEDPYEGSPEQWFWERKGDLKKQVKSLVRDYLAASSIEEKSEFVRNKEDYLSKSSDWKVRLNPRLDDVPKNPIKLDHTDQTGFLIWNTKDENYLPTRLYFVRQGEQLKLDWFASTAWSECSFVDLKKSFKQEDGEVMVRCLLSRKHELYAGPYNEKEHAEFMIVSPDKEKYFWAYTERNSALDIELRKLLDHGSFVVSLKKDVRVTIRVKKGRKDALPSQLELVELVHPKWVAP